MKRVKSTSGHTRIAFTERELDIMTVLWERGSSSVSEVRDRLPDRLAYTTVLTMLRILMTKGYVMRGEGQRAHRYSCLVHRDEAAVDALSYLTSRFFNGSPESLLASLLSTHPLSEAQIFRIRGAIEERLDQVSRRGSVKRVKPI
jgi:BlaI family penicillinase repressor